MSDAVSEWLVECCVEAARRSDCSKVKFGAVAINADGGMWQGWNHVPGGGHACATECAGGIRAGVKSGTMIERCYAIHAEQHALLNAGGQATRIAVLGVLPNGGRFDNGGGFYCTMCARIMRAAGVQTVTIWTADGWRDLTIQQAWEQSYGIGLGA